MTSKSSIKFASTKSIDDLHNKLKELHGTESEEAVNFINGLKQLASGMSSEKRIDFLRNHESGDYNSNPADAKAFIKANVSANNPKSEKAKIQSQLEGLDANNDADQIEALRAQIQALEQH